MKSGEYRQAEIDFKEAVRKHPENEIARYYLGRFLLAQNKAAEALPQFQKAVALDPGDADYYFWLGVTYGELGDSKVERISYEKALRLNGRHPQAHLYLGHLRLRNGEFKQARMAYDAVLKEVPTNAAALYNRALLLDIEGKDTAAKKAWLEYLKWYPAGQHARQAADHLNALGDFSYENHFLGNRAITLAEIRFQQSASSVSLSAYPSLRLVGAIVSNLKKGTLQVVVFDKDKQLAKQRAIAVKNTLHKLFPAIDPDRIRISWFGTPEKVIQGKKTYVKNESVRLFLTNWK
jgi:tetratricopeptide (TPR) repeat protein